MPDWILIISGIVVIVLGLIGFVYFDYGGLWTLGAGAVIAGAIICYVGVKKG